MAICDTSRVHSAIYLEIYSIYLEIYSIYLASSVSLHMLSMCYLLRLEREASEGMQDECVLVLLL